MNKKIILSLLFLFLFFLLNPCVSFAKKPVLPPKAAVFVPVNNIEENRIWIGTFQLVWNDLANEIVKGDIHFTGVKSDLADKLNKQGFNSSMLSSNSYYKTYGKISNRLKWKIERGIWLKFREKSDIINNINWEQDGLLVYAMLKKDFKFLKEFCELDKGKFLDSEVKFFGIRNNTEDKDLLNNLEIMFYENKDSYAVKIFTKEGDELLLYRTDDELELEEYYKNLNTKYANYNGTRKFSKDDVLKIPYIKFEDMFEYKELSNKPIEGTDYVIDGAIQTVKININNKGGTLKSEAALIMKMSLPNPQITHNFYYDKPFILFIKEKNKELPYFIAHFKNAALFEK